MQKMLLKELEGHQIDKQEFPGEFSFSDTFAKVNVEKPAEAYGKIEKIQEDFVIDTGLPILSTVNMLATGPLIKFAYEDEARGTSSLKPGN